MWYDNARDGHSRSPKIGAPVTPYDRNESICINDNTFFYAEYQGEVWTLCENHGLYATNIKTNQTREIHLGDSLTNRTIEYFTNDPQDKNSIWFSTIYGLCQYDVQEDKKTWFFPQKRIPTLLNNRLRTIYPNQDKKFFFRGFDHQGPIVVIFDRSIGVFDTLQSKSYRRVLKENEIGFSIIHQSRNGNFWLKGSSGMVEINVGKDTSIFHDQESFLPEDRIISFTSDENSNLWIITNRYILHYNPFIQKVLGMNYLADVMGLFNPIMYDQPLKQTQDGAIIAPGENGLIVFHPDSVRMDSTPPKIVLTDFKIFDKSQELGQAPELVRSIKIGPRDRSLTFEFSALLFDKNRNCRYQYKLDGWNNEWIDLGKNRTVTFTNLPPKTYVLNVRAQNANGIWNDPDQNLTLLLQKKPFWHQTWWAKIMGAAFIAIIGYLIYQFHLKRKLIQTEAQNLKKLNQLKTKLYTNITHEFRTPLTVILGMAQKIKEDRTRWFFSGLEKIERNGNYLLTLVNQMLSLAKFDEGKMGVTFIQSDIISFLNYFVESLRALAESKHLSLSFIPEVEEVIMDYDPEKIQMIFSNLITNAIKFTEPNGKIILNVDRLGQNLQVKIIDSGIGIPEEQIPYIFNRFFQVDDSISKGMEGTGIGLALTKELVQLLEGDIKVKSKVGNGTIFTVLLPIHNKAPNTSSPFTFKNEEILTSSNQAKEPRNKEENDELHGLVIEDSPDVAEYIESCLTDEYKITWAKDGQEGIEKAIDLIPDFIVSDVMMPHKSGFEVCETLKQDQRTSHIPIVLLTAKADETSKVQGLSFGADAYLVKPFNELELKIRISKLIEVRQLLLLHFAQRKGEEISKKKGDQGLYPIEDRFIKELKDTIKGHLLDADLDMNKLCGLLNMSRTQLFRKLKALKGISATKYINQVRVEEAVVYLKQSDLSIKEIAYRVGFNSPNYFRKQFSDRYGVSPTEFKKKNIGS